MGCRAAGPAQDGGECHRRPRHCQPAVHAEVDRWLDALFGSDACAWCQAPARAAGLCAACIAALPWNLEACPGCALPQPCIACLRRPPPWDAAWAAFVYRPPLPHLIHGLKYQGRFSAARLLATLMAQRLRRHTQPLPPVLLPVPLHPARLRRRGYNQATELARPLARALGMRVDLAALRRLRDTGDQTRLSAAARRRNLRDAFAARPDRVAGRHVAVLDDVLTTGATAAGVSQALRLAGAARIEIWACARTPPPRTGG